MKLLTLTVPLYFLVAFTISEVHGLSLRQALQSPRETLKLFSQYKTEKHLSFGASENRVRFLMFKKNAQLVSSLNSAPEETASFGLNLFSSMTDGEKNKWLGINATGKFPHTDILPVLSSNLNTPRKKDWVDRGAVTAVKNQDSCGSCWAFSAIATLETRYKVKSGRLRSFSDQEYLDCTPVSLGCNGGWYNEAFAYSQKCGGRIAASKDYPYVGKKGDCKGKSKPNAAVAFKITGVEKIAADEDSNIAALAKGALSMAVFAGDAFFQYQSGIFKDTTCTEAVGPNHAVTGVGYTERYVVIKNSWSKFWGDNGFMRVTRNYHNCGFWDYSSYPILEKTGKKDKGKDDRAATYDGDADYDDNDDDSDCDDNDDDSDYDDNDDDNDEDDFDDDDENSKCKDRTGKFPCQEEMCKFKAFAKVWCRSTCGHCEKKKLKCKDQHRYCEKDFCQYTDFAKRWCKNTCYQCDTSNADDNDDNDDNDCNNGLVRCPDGVCRHTHMC